MDTGLRLSRGLRLSFPIARLLIRRAAGRVKGKGLTPCLRAAALRFSASVVDFLLYCFCLLTPADNGPGIQVSNLAELAQALGSSEEPAAQGSSAIEDLEDQDGFEMDFRRRECRVVASR